MTMLSAVRRRARNLGVEIEVDGAGIHADAPAGYVFADSGERYMAEAFDITGTSRQQAYAALFDRLEAGLEKEA